MIEQRDEWLHEVGPDPAWQESFYFNWADAQQQTFTLARTGYRFHPRKTDGLVISLHRGELELYYGPADLDHEGDCREEDPAAGMRANDLVVTMIEPLRRWRLQIEGERGMDVVFEAHTPAFDYGAGGRLASTMTGAHFEQSGRVTGWTHFGEERLEIDALGQRDKSWGVRDWARLEGWNWISGQLGTDWSFNVMQTIEAGKPLDNGFVHRDGANHAVVEARIDYEWGEREHELRSTRIEIVEAGGAHHRLRAEALGAFPILRGDVWLEETHVEFKLEGADSRTGQGVIEHVWRATADEIAARAERIARIADVFRR
ncbi:MAG: hypothetical protein JRH10_06965 [Deltaproteobacteria bacterium]|nr:hypothetical protein [Deltaproteobacteria bacterium]